MSQQVAILLASYNGEQFIRAQIDSILSQSCNDWHLFIRDDDSTDRPSPSNRNTPIAIPNR